MWDYILPISDRGFVASFIGIDPLPARVGTRVVLKGTAVWYVLCRWTIFNAADIFYDWDTKQELMEHDEFFRADITDKEWEELILDFDDDESADDARYELEP